MGFMVPSLDNSILMLKWVLRSSPSSSQAKGSGGSKPGSRLSVDLEDSHSQSSGDYRNLGVVLRVFPWVKGGSGVDKNLEFPTLSRRRLCLQVSLRGNWSCQGGSLDRDGTKGTLVSVDEVSSKS